MFCSVFRAAFIVSPFRLLAVYEKQETHCSESITRALASSLFYGLFWSMSVREPRATSSCPNVLVEDKAEHLSSMIEIQDLSQLCSDHPTVCTAEDKNHPERANESSHKAEPALSSLRKPQLVPVFV